jgi:DASS family divalent anion:Na+ symporter
MRNLDLPKLIPSAVVVAFTLMIWFVIPAPTGVSLNAWHLFALFVGTIVGIISNAMPLGAISIVAIALVAVTEVTNPGKPAAAAALHFLVCFNIPAAFFFRMRA